MFSQKKKETKKKKHGVLSTREETKKEKNSNCGDRCTMSSFGDYVDQAAAEVLSRNEILMANPGSSRISSFYPTPAESTTTIAQSVNNSGQLFVKANSKTIPGASDFQISTSNILDTPILTMRIDVPALLASDNLGSPENTYFGPFAQGWGFDAIESVEVSYANSNISALRLDGIALKEWSLMQCETEKEKQQLLQAAGAFKVLDRSQTRSFIAAVPISFLNWRSAGGVKEGFPIDGRALNGPIQFQFRFRELGEFMGPYMSANAYSANVSGTAAARISNPVPGGKLPTAFADLQMTFRTYQLMDGAFSVSKALMANPGMIYSIPSLWSNSYTYTVKMSGGRGSIQLNSAPAGMIQAILINVRPITTTSSILTDDDPPNTDIRVDRLGHTSVAEVPGLSNVEGSRLAVVPRYNSAPLNYLRLQYSGQNIFLAQNAQELDLFYKQIYGNDLKVYVPACNGARSVVSSQGSLTFSPQAGEIAAGSTATTDTVNFPDQATLYLENQTYNIPLMHDGKRVFDQKGFENLPHYSGSTLSLDFGIEDKPRASYGYTRADTGVRTSNVKPSTAPLSAITPNAPSTFSGGAYRHVASDSDGGQNMTQRVYGNASDSTNPERYNTCVDWFKSYYSGASGESQAIVTITYIVSALLQSTNGIVELQL